MSPRSVASVRDCCMVTLGVVFGAAAMRIGWWHPVLWLAGFWLPTLVYPEKRSR